TCPNGLVPQREEYERREVILDLRTVVLQPSVGLWSGQCRVQRRHGYDGAYFAPEERVRWVAERKNPRRVEGEVSGPDRADEERPDVCCGHFDLLASKLQYIGENGRPSAKQGTREVARDVRVHVRPLAARKDTPQASQ